MFGLWPHIISDRLSQLEVGRTVSWKPSRSCPFSYSEPIKNGQGRPQCVVINTSLGSCCAGCVLGQDNQQIKYARLQWSLTKQDKLGCVGLCWALAWAWTVWPVCQEAGGDIIIFTEIEGAPALQLSSRPQLCKLFRTNTSNDNRYNRSEVKVHGRIFLLRR